MTGRLEICPTMAHLVQACSEKIIALLHEAIRQRGTASFVLSGGSTPRALYEWLGADDVRDEVEWAKVHLFWGDERCVAPTMPQSNFRMANEALISKINIPAANVHRIPAERPPQEAAQFYQAELKRVFSLREGQLPVFTVMLLGLGEEGHTASLFPNTAGLQEHARLVTEVYVESLQSSRVTMTLPVINAALDVIFLVAGKAKAGILREVLEGNVPRSPASLVNPSSGRLSWFVDRDAASQLHTQNTS